jgi:hypothetical protein
MVPAVGRVLASNLKSSSSPEKPSGAPCLAINFYFLEWANGRMGTFLRAAFVGQLLSNPVNVAEPWTASFSNLGNSMQSAFLLAAPGYSPRVQNARMGLLVQLTASVCKW